MAPEPNGNGSWLSPKTVLQLGPVAVIALMLTWFLISAQKEAHDEQTTILKEILKETQRQTAVMESQTATAISRLNR